MVDVSRLAVLTPQEAYQELNTSRRGLSEEEVRKRQQQYGPNVLLEPKKTPLYMRFFAQFTDLFAVMLIIASILVFAVYLFFGRNQYDLIVAIAIISVVIINATVGFFQEYRAEKATEALKKLVPAQAKVIRGGEKKQVLADEVVPGDVLVLDEGDNIVADCRLVEEFELRTNNMTLTGESDPVRKFADPSLEKDLSRTEIPNLVFMGTSVASGSGLAVAYATGMATEFGNIFKMTTAVEDPPSPLKLELATTAKRVATVAISIGVLLFFAAPIIKQGMATKEAFIFALGVMVALCPEGLPATLSVALAIGVQRMVKENALIKRLSSVETLGSTNVICTDKTGTLTAAEMTVREAWMEGSRVEITGAGYSPKGQFLIDGKALSLSDVAEKAEGLFKIGSFCNNAKLKAPSDKETAWKVLGDPTEGALLVLARKGGFDVEEELKEEPLCYQLPFDSNRKQMTTIHAKGNKMVAYVKGAPVEVLSLCSGIWEGGKIRKLEEKDRQEILAQNDEFAKASLRVLAMAFRVLPEGLQPFTEENTEHDLVFVGLVGMMDPPRPEVEEAIRKAKRAGIRTIMVTGDYGLTAEAIARKIGIVSEEHPRIVTGFELSKMSDDDLQKELKEHEEILFARVSPEHKMRLTRALKKMDLVVAMTGDGVNDAPALKAADIGVAMGITGTDVSKESAVMILLDDSFASIVKAVEQGRAVYNNIKKFVLYIFSHNLAELFPFVFATVFGVNNIPLNALQVLAIDLGSDVLPSLALGTEPPEPNVMEEKPRPRTERLMNKKLVKRLIFLGTVQSIGAIFGFLYMLLSHGWKWGVDISTTNPALLAKAVTMTHGGIVFSQFANGFCCRTEKESLFKIGVFSNKSLLLAEILGILIMFAISYVPFLQTIFRTGPLESKDWLILAFFGLVLFFAEEARKWFARRREVS